MKLLHSSVLKRAVWRDCGPFKASQAPSFVARPVPEASAPAAAAGGCGCRAGICILVQARARALSCSVELLLLSCLNTVLRL